MARISRCTRLRLTCIPRCSSQPTASASLDQFRNSLLVSCLLSLVNFARTELSLNQADGVVEMEE